MHNVQVLSKCGKNFQSATATGTELSPAEIISINWLLGNNGLGYHFWFSDDWLSENWLSNDWVRQHVRFCCSQNSRLCQRRFNKNWLKDWLDRHWGNFGLYNCIIGK